jgi:hypothetical protein
VLCSPSSFLETPFRRWSVDRVSLVLGMAAACIHVSAYITYNIQTSKGLSKPRASVIGVSVFLAVLLAITYLATTTNLAITLQYIAGSTSAMVTLLNLWIRKRLTRFSKEEYVYGAISFVAGIVWYVFHWAAFANFIILATVLMTYKTLYQGVWRNPYTETARAWLLWALANAVNTVNVIHLHKEWTAYVSPIVLLISHLAVAVLSSTSRKRWFTARTGITRA